jgi:hypothetical protein
VVARLVDWRWIGGGEVEGVGGRVAVVVEWGSDEWRWRSNYHIVVGGIDASTSSSFVTRHAFSCRRASSRRSVVVVIIVVVIVIIVVVIVFFVILVVVVVVVVVLVIVVVIRLHRRCCCPVIIAVIVVDAQQSDEIW